MKRSVLHRFVTAVVTTSILGWAVSGSARRQRVEGAPVGSLSTIPNARVTASVAGTFTKALFANQDGTTSLAKAVRTDAASVFGDIQIVDSSHDAANVHAFGAVGDGVADDTAAIQAAIDAVGGVGGFANTTGTHGKIRFPPGVYKTTAQLTLRPSTWLELEGDSRKGTYIFQQGGTGAAIQFQGSTFITSANRTDSNNDGGVYIHDLSIGSTVGHALSCKNAYQAVVRNLSLFSAAASSNYFDVDGCAVLTAENIRTNGNDDFPATAKLLDGRTQGVYGVYITTRVDVNGRYNTSGELFFSNLHVEGQQTHDAVYAYNAAAVPFAIYPIIINGGEFVVPDTYAGYRQDGAVIAKLQNLYIERVTGTCDAIRIDSTQGAGELTAVDIYSPTGNLNFNGNGINKPSLNVIGGLYKTFVSASNVYGVLDLRSIKLTTDTASASFNYRGGDQTHFRANVVINTGTGTTTPSVLGTESTISRVSRLFDATSSTTPADVSGLSHQLGANGVYTFEAILYTTSDIAAGVKFAIGGTATATDIIYEAVVYDEATAVAQTRATSLGKAVGAVTAVTAAYCRLTGTIRVRAAGTLTVQFSQNASSRSSSRVLVGSTFVVTQIGS